MNKARGFLVALVVLIFFIGTSLAEIYKWVDDNGVMHFSDTQPAHISDWEEEQNPASSNQTLQNSGLQKVKLDTDTISEILDQLEGDEEETEDKQQPAVELYVTSWCPWCNKAKSFFISRGITFTEYNIEKDQEAARRMRSLTKSRGVPFAVINGRQIQGYSEADYSQALQN